MTTLLVVGGGKMGEALVGGLLAGGSAEAADGVVAEPYGPRRAELAERFPGLVLVPAVDHLHDSVPADAVVAVKPQQVAEVCRALGAVGVRRILSIAAGVRLATMEAEVPEGTAVVRAMPNTPAMVGAGASAIAGGAAATDADLDWAEQVLGAVGTGVRVAESQIDAVTGLSGSGPAYVFLVAEAMIDAGVLAGLPRDLATQLTNQTLLGAAQLLGSDGPAADHRAAVTSPGGTTAAGLRALEARAVRSAFLDAVMAAKARSVEMSS